MSKPTFRTFGCKLNYYETETMKQLCDKEGLQNITVINSCAVTAEAVRKAKKIIRRSSRETPSKKIIVTGCAAQVEPELFNSMNEVDFVIGNEKKLSSATWSKIKQARSAESVVSKVDVNDIMSVNKLNPWEITKLANRSRAYVQIQNGCDHRCTFCIIPYGRGNSRSVPEKKVLSQVQKLVNNGFKEIVLTGVDITSWGNDLPTSLKLGSLVKKILSEVTELPRLRLSSIDSIEVDEELTDLIVSEQRFMPHLHLSLQSGDNLILKRMKRRHTREQAINFCKTIQLQRPEVTFGADIIAGFPTENELMFQNSLELINECNLTWLHVFPFSARAGTPASRMPTVYGTEIKSRANQLRVIGQNTIIKHLDSQLGVRQSVLIEGNGKGRTETFAEAVVDPTLKSGTIVNLVAHQHDGSKLFCS